METVLTEKRVEEVFEDCLFREDRDTGSGVMVLGVIRISVFNRGRLDTHKVEIEAMLEELPSGFREPGVPYTSAGVDKNGRRWTKSGRILDCLFKLGIAINRVVEGEATRAFVPSYRIVN